MEQKKNNKKKILIIVLAVLLVVATIGTTIAWLTRTNSITNSFSVGSFEYPTTDPTDPTETISIQSHLYEPSWDPTAAHKLLPGVTFAKDPYVGIGAGSEDAQVYVYVQNNMSSKVYFTLNSGWEAVSGETTAGSANGTYTSGLFKYTAGLTASSTDDVWTSTPVFSSVVIADNANGTDFEVAQGQSTDIIVSSFIHQAKDGSGNLIADATILAAAKEAFHLN